MLSKVDGRRLFWHIWLSWQEFLFGKFALGECACGVGRADMQNKTST